MSDKSPQDLKKKKTKKKTNKQNKARWIAMTTDESNTGTVEDNSSISVLKQITKSLWFWLTLSGKTKNATYMYCNE